MRLVRFTQDSTPYRRRGEYELGDAEAAKHVRHGVAEYMDVAEDEEYFDLDAFEREGN